MAPEYRVSMLLDNMTLADPRNPNPSLGNAHRSVNPLVCSCRDLSSKTGHDACCRLSAEHRRGVGAHPSKLTKPPKVQIPRKRPVRNRLQRQHKSHVHKKHPSAALYVLKYESYPYVMEEASILGIFKSIDAASAAAFTNGAYAFSRNGLNDGMEYLTPTGRIKILEHEVCTLPRRRGSIVQRDFHCPTLPISPTNVLDRVIALRNFTQPEGRQFRRPSSETYRPSPHRPTYLALHRSAMGLVCLGAFAERIKAWNACLKDFSLQTYDTDVQHEMRWMDENGHPHVQAKIPRTGRHVWDVVALKVDEVAKKAPVPLQEPTWRDV
jgi:hypothetical protein